MKFHKRTIEDYRSITGLDVINQIHRASKPLLGRRIVMINSTATGGGVAELLNSIVILLNSLGIDTTWEVIKGPESFFNTTKNFHNALQGEDITVTKRMRELYEQVNYDNANLMKLDQYDLIVVHDPQPLPIINFVKKKAPWIWRFHSDMTNPSKMALRYLQTFIQKYDSVIVTRKQYYKKSMGIPYDVVTPSIDPLIDKNKKLTLKDTKSILKRNGINLKKPIISQISRFDKWKDPLGVIKAYHIVQKKFDCQLVLLGNLASDDPEGPKLFQEVLKNSNKNASIIVHCEDNDLLVNALQRMSKVVIQKSLREGFALTVSEALWKETPVVGSRVGGIPLQVIHGKTGYLVGNIQQTANACLKLLREPNRAKRMGKRGKEHVLKHFLTTRHVLDYLTILSRYLPK